MFSNKLLAWVIATGAVLMTGCVSAATDTPLPLVLSNDVPATVNQMLAIDAQRALVAEQRLLLEEQRKGGYGVVGLSNGASGEAKPEVAPKPTETPKPVELPVRIEVMGIFGIGKDLRADVEIGGGRYRFVRGYELPEGASDNFRYRLVSIQTPCVLLSDVAGAQRKVCLTNPSL
ncbi:hypothetical protein [Pseudomonas sp. UMAB-40]|uniref:hypothetical protein n=1 Tax=Pseudomonas sp. UMAB-40 TaxID=1365407 RepID=UPI001C592D44|nr:hypothetical protein [Pseudomonas sp. UMAB-40]